MKRDNLIVVDNSLCDFCGICVACCPQNAIQVTETTWLFDSTLCNSCFICVRLCPTRALSEEKENAQSV